MTIQSKIGISDNIGTGNFVILSNATVSNPTGEQVRIVSTSVDDDSSPSGTGAQKVILTYFNNSWTLKSEVIDLDGTTPVDTVNTDIFRIECFEIFKVGSGQSAAGTITVKSLDSVNLFAQIDTGKTTFERALHFVSPGHVASILQIIANCTTSAGITFIVFVTQDNTPNGGGPIMIPHSEFTIINSVVQTSFIIPVFCDASKSTEGLTMGILVRGSSASQAGTASFLFEDTI